VNAIVIIVEVMGMFHGLHKIAGLQGLNDVMNAWALAKYKSNF
jgi:hypothetical protein